MLGSVKCTKRRLNVGSVIVKVMRKLKFYAIL